MGVARSTEMATQNAQEPDKSDSRIPHGNQVEGVTHKNLKSSHKGPGEKSEKSRILKNVVQWSTVVLSDGFTRRGKREGEKGEDLGTLQKDQAVEQTLSLLGLNAAQK